MNPSVLVVEDDAGLREALCDTLEMSGIAASAAADGRSALGLLEEGRFDLVVSDIQMKRLDGLELLRRIKALYPRLPVLLMTAFGTVRQAVDAMQNGAVDYLVKPFEAEVLVSKVSSYVNDEAAGTADMVSVAPQSRELMALARKVAATNLTAMITGESGTGKEVLARLIHGASPRSAGPFVAVNCAAIPDNMLEAMLFGYEKGAFTGAYKGCPGKFEQAQRGTLLLDEISEMDLGLQAKLLRVLQEREVERLGGRELIPLDVRVVVTSNRDLKQETAAGRFREDLFYRISVFPIHVTPLRERADEILPLAEHLLARAARAMGRPTPRIGEAAAHRLRSHAWPGNVRELDNVLQRALVLGHGGRLEAPDLLMESDGAPGPRPLAPEPAGSARRDSLGDELRENEFRLIVDALEAAGGNRKAVAEKLGISARTLRYKLARMRDAGWTIPGG